jgi:hypothetical protein
LTFYFLGDFATARQYAMRGAQIRRGMQSPVGELDLIAVHCLCFEAFCNWHIGKVTSCQSTIAEAISLAKERNDMHGLADALSWAAILGQVERNPAEVEHCASDLIELSTRQNFTYWRGVGVVLLGWARSASGDTAEGISSIEDGIEEVWKTGTLLALPYFLALKAEALHLADRTSEALDAIREAEAMVERSEQGDMRAELQRLRGIFLEALGAGEAQTEASFREAIATAKEQKSLSLATRAEASYAEYRARKGHSAAATT